MFPHSILEKFAVKLNALERDANILYQKTSSTGKNNEQFICPEKQREKISNCLINKNEIVQQKSLRKANPTNRKLQINEQSSLQEGQILDPPKSNTNVRSQQIKNRVRKTWTKPNVQSFQKAAIVELETKQEKETKRIKEIEIKEIKQQKRKNTPDSIKDRIRKTWIKPDGKLEQDEKETKQIKETYKQKLKAQSHKSTIHINSEDSNRHHQIIQETQELKVKSKGKICLNENNLPYVYMMDNLVSMYLCNRVPGQLIKIYIKQLSCLYEIPYNKILIFFGIEALIARFCTNHDISSQFLDNYLCSELEMMLPHFINRVRISNWYVIQRVALGVVKRLGIKKEITDHWLLTVLNKSKKFLREGKVDVQKIFRVAKSREISSLNLCEEPTQNQMNQVNYKGENMKQFLRTNQQILSLIQFRDTDEQQVIQTSEREGVSNKLTYFKKLKLIAQQNQKQKQKQEGGKKNKKNKKKFEAQILSNCPEAYQVSSCQIQLNQEPQSDISFISQQSYQKQNSDESFVKVSDEDKQTTRGKKQKKLKQKKMDKQKQKHTYNLRRGIGIQEESRFIQKYKPTKEQKQRQKTKQKQKMLQKIEMKQINKKTESKRTNVNRDEQIKDVIQWLEQNQISESPFKAENNMVENIEKIKKSHKIKKLEIEEQGLVKMDKILFQFFQQKPELTIKMIKQQISRILKEEMNIPLKFHSKISDKWLERFRGARIR